MIVEEDRVRATPAAAEVGSEEVRVTPPAYRGVALLGLLAAATAPLWVLAPEGLSAAGFVAPFVAVPLGAAAVWHRGVWGRAVGLVASLGLLVVAAPFAPQTLRHPDSFFDFFPSVSLLLGALLAAGGSAASLLHERRRADSRPAPAQRAVTTAAAVALAGLAVLSGALTLSGRHTVSALDRFGAEPVTMVGFAFEPATLTVREGRPARFVVRNDDLALHTFTIDELGVDAIVKPGSEVLVEFTPDRAGTYLLYCRPHTHEREGMVGAFAVE